MYRKWGADMKKVCRVPSCLRFHRFRLVLVVLWPRLLLFPLARLAGKKRVPRMVQDTLFLSHSAKFLTPFAGNCCKALIGPDGIGKAVQLFSGVDELVLLMQIQLYRNRQGEKICPGTAAGVDQLMQIFIPQRHSPQS